ncbi:hypothetical protein ACFLXQ_03860 [Chloroflexota bacterium]
MAVTDTPQLRPLSIGKLLDQTIRLYRRNFLKFIGIIAIIQIPFGLLQLGLGLLTINSISQLQNFEDTGVPANPFAMFGPGYYLGVCGNLLLSIVSLIFIYGLATAALSFLVAGNYVEQPLGIIEAYRKIGNNWRRLIVAIIIALLISMGLFVWLLVPCIGWITSPGPLAFIWMIIMPLVAPAIVLEKHSKLGIRRVWDLSRRHFWRVVGFAFILTLFAQLIVTGPTFLVSYFFQFLTDYPIGTIPPPSILALQTITQSLVGLVFGLIYLPIQLVGMILMYLDLRVRTEGLDLIFQGSSDIQVNIEEIAAQAPLPGENNWITWTEIGYFLLLTLGLIAVVAIFFAIFVGIGMLLGLAAMSGYS